MIPSIKENTNMTHTPGPWKVLWKHDTHKVRRDKQGRIIDNVIVPFEDYVHAMHCVNTHEANQECIEELKKDVDKYQTRVLKVLEQRNKLQKQNDALVEALEKLEQRITKSARAFYGDGKRSSLQVALEGWKEEILPIRELIAAAKGAL